MVVIDVFGKIDKTLISDKLKVYISNIPDDWKNDLKLDMLLEISQQKMDIEDDLIRHGKTYRTEYSFQYLKDIVQSILNGFSTSDLDSIDSCLQYLVDNLVCMFFDYEYNDMPFFDWTNNCFDGRCCEEDYAEKLIYFGNFVNHNVKNGISVRCIYSSNMEPFANTRILSQLSFNIHSEFEKQISKDYYIKELKEMGSRIDCILNSPNDYNRLDYIINAIYKDNCYNHNHYMRTFTLLELVLLTRKQGTNEIDTLLIPYLNSEYGNRTVKLAKLLRQMRNKIGHGDFEGFNKKAEEYAQIFMKDFLFDYSEHSRLGWILVNICCLLDDLLRSVLIQQINAQNHN